MSERQQLAAIIPHWRGKELLARCIGSLQTQDSPPEEIVIVDNCSGERLSDLASELPGAKLLQMPQNLGFGTAINAAVERTTAELLLVLNDDAYLLPGALSEIRRAASTYGEIAAFALRVVDEDECTLQSTGLCFTIAGYGNRSGKERFKDVTEPTQVFGPCGAAAVYRRRPFLDAGGFNPAFFLMYEDLELAVRFNVRGYRTLLLPRATCGHRYRGSAANFRGIIVEQLVANALSTMITSVPGSFWSKHLARAILPFYSRALSLLCKEGYFRGVFRGLLKALLRFPSSLRRRRALGLSLRSGHLPEDLLFAGPLEFELESRRVRLMTDGRPVR